LNSQRRVAVGLLALTLMAMAIMTLYPVPDDVARVERTSFWCLICGELGVVDVLLNLLLFVPYGMALFLLGMSWRKACILIVASTITIELLQLTVVSGRDASLSDVLTNSLGGSVGFFLGRNWQRVVFPSRGESRWWACAILGAWLGVQILSAWGLQTELPRSLYYGQWAPALAQFDQFTGTVHRVELDGMPLPNGPIAENAALRRTLLTEPSVLRVAAVSGSSTRRLSPIFSIFDEGYREILVLGQNGRDVVFRLRTRLNLLRLRSPALAVRGALPGDRGVALAFEASRVGGRLQLNVWSGDSEPTQPTEGELVLSPSMSWSFLLPYEQAFGGEQRYLTMLWLAAMLFPAGYWSAGAVRTRPGAMAAGLAVALTLYLGLRLVPLWFDLPPVHLTEWLAAAFGWGTGWTIRRLVGRR
jgi:VanZ like protein